MMIVPRDILVPIDFSETSKAALAWASGLGHSCNAALHLLHVLESVTVVDPVAVPFGPRARIEEAIEASAWKELRALLSPDDQRRLRVTLAVEWGTPVVEIVRYASSHHFGLIAMGTHGHGRAHHMLLGSVAAHVVRKAPCTVLVVRSPAPHAPERDISSEGHVMSRVRLS
jgi:universal stress protein A